jgi:hypothetical protein
MVETVRSELPNLWRSMNEPLRLQAFLSDLPHTIGRFKRQACYARSSTDVSKRGRPRDFRLWHGPNLVREGRAVPLCPGRSDVDLFGYGESVVDLNSEIPHRALNLLVPQQKLHCRQIASAAVDECCLGSAQ